MLRQFWSCGLGEGFPLQFIRVWRRRIPFVILKGIPESRFSGSANYWTIHCFSAISFLNRFKTISFYINFVIRKPRECSPRFFRIFVRAMRCYPQGTRTDAQCCHHCPSKLAVIGFRPVSTHGHKHSINIVQNIGDRRYPSLCLTSCHNFIEQLLSKPGIFISYSF